MAQMVHLVIAIEDAQIIRVKRVVDSFLILFILQLVKVSVALVCMGDSKL